MNNIEIIETYYKAMANKDIQKIEKYLHPQVTFIGPITKVKGKEAFLEATKKFMDFFQSLTIRAKFGADDQAVLIYDVDFASPIGTLPSASFMTFEKGLITKIELFFDARPFERK